VFLSEEGEGAGLSARRRKDNLGQHEYNMDSWTMWGCVEFILLKTTKPGSRHFWRHGISETRHPDRLRISEKQYVTADETVSYVQPGEVTYAPLSKEEKRKHERHELRDILNTRTGSVA
jgi:hypothetical protein